jgi:uncharacterized membrane protein
VRNIIVISACVWFPIHVYIIEAAFNQQKYLGDQRMHTFDYFDNMLVWIPLAVFLPRSIHDIVYYCYKKPILEPIWNIKLGIIL